MIDSTSVLLLKKYKGKGAFCRTLLFSVNLVCLGMIVKADRVTVGTLPTCDIFQDSSCIQNADSSVYK